MEDTAQVCTQCDRYVSDSETCCPKCNSGDRLERRILDDICQKCGQTWNQGHWGDGCRSAYGMLGTRYVPSESPPIVSATTSTPATPKKVRCIDDFGSPDPDFLHAGKVYEVKDEFNVTSDPHYHLVGNENGYRQNRFEVVADESGTDAAPVTSSEPAQKPQTTTEQPFDFDAYNGIIHK